MRILTCTFVCVCVCVISMLIMFSSIIVSSYTAACAQVEPSKHICQLVAQLYTGMYMYVHSHVYVCVCDFLVGKVISYCFFSYIAAQVEPSKDTRYTYLHTYIHTYTHTHI